MSINEGHYRWCSEETRTPSGDVRSDWSRNFRYSVKRDDENTFVGVEERHDFIQVYCAVTDRIKLSLPSALLRSTSR